MDKSPTKQSEGGENGASVHTLQSKTRVGSDAEINENGLFIKILSQNIGCSKYITNLKFDRLINVNFLGKKRHCKKSLDTKSS